MTESELKLRELLGCKSLGGYIMFDAGILHDSKMTLYPNGRLLLSKGFDLDIVVKTFWEWNIKNFKAFANLSWICGCCPNIPNPAKITITTDRKCIFENMIVTNEIKNIWETIAEARPEETISKDSVWETVWKFFT